MKKLPKFTFQYFIDLVFDRLMNILNSALNWCLNLFSNFFFESWRSILEIPSNFTVIWMDRNWQIKHFDKKSFFTIDHNGVISYCRHNHNGNCHLCACNCPFCSHFDEFGYRNFINWNSLGSQNFRSLALKIVQVG